MCEDTASQLRCEADAMILGTIVVCSTPLNEDGACPREHTHVYGTPKYT